MTTAKLTLHSQAVSTYDGNQNVSTSGTLRSGDYEVAAWSTVAASALRFALPGDFDGSETVTAATLNLRVRTGVPQTSAGYGNHKSRIRVLAATDQSLPTTGAGVVSAAGGTNEVTIGEGTYTPALDHTVTDTFADVAIDITSLITQAVAAGRLSGGWLVVLIQPVEYDEANYLDANGLSQTAPPTIDITYSDGGPPLEGYELQLDDDLAAWTITAEADVRSQIAAVDEPVAPWTLDAAAATQNTASLVQTFPQWSLQALASSPILGQADLTVQPWTLDAVAQNGEGRQAALAADLAAWTITSEAMVGNPAALDQALTPWTITASAAVSIRTGDRSLFPARLFPQSLMT